MLSNEVRYWISFCFKAPVIGFDFCKRCHHYLKHFSKTPHYRVSGKRHTHLCYKIYQAHSRPISAGGKGFSDQSDHRCLNGRHFIFVNFFKMGTWSVSPNRSGFRCFVGITYSATFRYIPSPQSDGQRSNLTTEVKTTTSCGSRVF